MKRVLIIFNMLLAYSVLAQKELTSVKQSNPMNSINLSGRKSFVLGNYKYNHIRKLTNPQNDVIDLKNSLTQLKFNTTYTFENLKKSEFEISFSQFIQNLNQSDTVIFYYSGHGASIGRENFLIPVDATFNCAEDLLSNSIKLSSILDSFKSKNIKNCILILDACRNLSLNNCNNLSTFNYGFSRPLDNLDGSLIVFATSEGSTADDNWFNNRNSIFTYSLLKFLTQENLSINNIIDSTKKDVIKITNDKQHPKVYSDLENKNIVFNGRTIPFTIPSNIPRIVKQEELEIPNSTVQCPLCGKHRQILIEFEDGIWGYIFYASLRPRNPFIVSRIAGRNYKDTLDEAIRQLYRYKAYGKFLD